MMSTWQKIKTRLSILRRIPCAYYFVAGVLFVMMFYVLVFREKTIAYNYGGETCDRQLVLLPGIFRQSDGEKYQVSARGGWSVAGYQITATSLCVLPLEAPAEKTSETVSYAPWGGWIARLTYRLDIGPHPAVDTAILKSPIPASRALKLPLSEPDVTFSYKLETGGGRASCESGDKELSCDIPALRLKQGSEYAVVLEKYFKDKKVDEAMSAHIETLSPLSIVDTSIKADATVYDKPKSVSITVDKAVRKADFVARRTDGDLGSEIKTSTELREKEVVVIFAEDLPRQATVELSATTFEAVDGSTPLDSYSLTFKTSGGPRVTGANVGSSGVAPGSQIIVAFDQELAPDQDIGALVATSGVVLEARRGNQLIFSTSGAERCAAIAITLKADIASPYGVSGLSAWQYSGRMRCYTVTTIGYSSQGRAISAYHFGDSGPSILYTGAIHGNEVSTKYLMDRWIQELDANPAKLPSGKRIIVVPAINPDGLARNSRLNARGVDLNRNFGVSDWKKDVEDVNGGPFPNGGGSEPMSEPETRAIAAFVAQQRPELVISYHSIGGLVISNQGGQASARASQYANLSGYRLSGGDSGEFGYQITGTADDYYREKLGVASILVELGSHSYHQFERNQAAMWAMLR